jgi:hypothetical protein
MAVSLIRSLKHEYYGKMFDLVFAIVVLAVFIDGILAGAGLDQMIKQLPSRKQIGVVAYSKYFMAADLANGKLWYGILGISAYAITIGSAIAAYLQSVESSVMAFLFLAAVLALVHAIGTIQAAPTAFRVLEAKGDETSLTELFNRFSKWTTVRGVAGILMFLAVIGALAIIA